MLETLEIKNLAVFEQASFSPGEGLTVLTGKTGAGKSVLLKALQLISGGRGSADLVRNGCAQAEVEALFILEDWAQEKICSEFPSLAEVTQGDELVVRRVIKTTGRGQVYLNGTLRTLAELEHLSPLLIDITAQHSQQSLLGTKTHRELVDSFGIKSSQLRTVYDSYQAWKNKLSELERFREDFNGRAELLRRIEFEFEELDALGLEEGEKESLEKALARDENVEQLQKNLTEVLASLDTNETSVANQLNQSFRLLQDAVGVDSSLQATLGNLDSARLQLEETRADLETYLNTLTVDPVALEKMRERLSDIKRLERKYARDAQALVEYRNELFQQRESLQGLPQNEEVLLSEVEDLEKTYLVDAKNLSKKRQGLASKLAKTVLEELSQLEMAKAKFEVEISQSDSPGPFGIDRVEFKFSANPGEPLKSLQLAASGGELSRLILVLKLVLNQRNRPGLQVFDEVDTGVGGGTAQLIGEKLSAISRSAQVLGVTHSPQIASIADSHYSVEKRIVEKGDEERTSSSISALKKDQRVAEVARMLAGKEVTSEFIESAKQLLKAGPEA